MKKLFGGLYAIYGCAWAALAVKVSSGPYALAFAAVAAFCFLAAGWGLGPACTAAGAPSASEPTSAMIEIRGERRMQASISDRIVPRDRRM